MLEYFRNILKQKMENNFLYDNKLKQHDLYEYLKDNWAFQNQKLEEKDILFMFSRYCSVNSGCDINLLLASNGVNVNLAKKGLEGIEEEIHYI